MQSRLTGVHEDPPASASGGIIGVSNWAQDKSCFVIHRHFIGSFPLENSATPYNNRYAFFFQNIGKQRPGFHLFYTIQIVITTIIIQ